MDPYKVLRISSDASEDEVRKAYRKMAAKYHPDAGGEAWIFQQVQEAYKMITEGEDQATQSAPPPQQPVQPTPQPQPVSDSQITDGMSGSASGQLDPGSFGKQPGGFRKKSRSRTRRQIPKPKARTTTKFGRRAKATRKRSQDEMVRIAILGICMLVAFAVVAVGGMMFYNQLKDSGLIAKKGDPEGGGETSTSGTSTGGNDASTSGSSSSGGSRPSRINDYVQLQGNNGNSNSQPPSDNTPPDSTNNFNPDTDSNNSNDLTSGGSFDSGNSDDNPSMGGDSLTGRTEEPSNDGGRSFILDNTPKPMVENSVPLDAPSDFGSLRLKQANRDIVVPTTTPMGHEIAKLVSVSTTFDPMGSDDANRDLTYRSILSAVQKRSELFGVNVFLDNGIVRTADKKRGFTKNCASLEEVLDYEELEGFPIRLSLNVIDQLSEELLAKCIGIANHYDFVADDIKLQFRIELGSDSADTAKSLISNIPSDIRDCLEFVAVIDEDLNLDSGMDAIKEMGFDQVSVRMGSDFAKLSNLARQAGMTVGLEGIEGLVGNSETVRSQLLMSLRDEVDTIYLVEISDADVSALSETENVAYQSETVPLKTSPEPFDDGGCLISAIISFPTSVDDGSTQCILSKFEDGEGFRLEVVNPLGRGDSDTVLNFTVGLDGGSGQEFTTSIRYSQLPKDSPTHLVACFPGYSEFKIVVDGGAYQSKSDTPVLNGWVGRTEQEVSIGENHSSADRFLGEIEMISVIPLVRGLND